MKQLMMAIDPGAQGGMALRLPDGAAICYPMPATDGDIVELIEELWALRNDDEPGCCYMEKVNGRGGLPGVRMFNFGQNYGLVLGALAALRIPTVLIEPRQWQKRLSLGKAGKSQTKWKNKLKAEAQRRFPLCKVTLKTADALLILAAMEEVRK